MIGDFPVDPDWTAPELEAFEGLLLHRDMPFDEVSARVTGRLVYLATPYSRLVTGPGGRFQLARSIEVQARASRWALRFAKAGVTALAPITLAGDIIYHDQLGRAGGHTALDPLDHVFWEAWCRPMLAAAGAVVIPPIPGWDVSLGVWREAAAALGAMRPVYLVGEK